MNNSQHNSKSARLTKSPISCRRMRNFSSGTHKLYFITSSNGGNRELRDDLLYRNDDADEAMEDDDAILH